MVAAAGSNADMRAPASAVIAHRTRAGCASAGVGSEGDCDVSPRIAAVSLRQYGSNVPEVEGLAQIRHPCRGGQLPGGYRDQATSGDADSGARLISESGEITGMNLDGTK